MDEKPQTDLLVKQKNAIETIFDVDMIELSCKHEKISVRQWFIEYSNLLYQAYLREKEAMISKSLVESIHK